MQETITYSLVERRKNSEEYYNAVKAFAKEVLDKASESIGPDVNEFITYIKEFKLEEVRKTEEYILELISFGILWYTYGNAALEVKHAPFITLSRMAEWRKKHQKLKQAIDLFRGIMTTLVLLPKKERTTEINLPTIEQIDKVCSWFEATGEFREEALRFIRWRAFWSTIGHDRFEQKLKSIALFTRWFESRSLEVLGDYTQNVESFIEKSQSRYRWREDRISCTRTRLEYHLNMVGAEIMNLAFREDFVNTEITSVLVPGCMRGRPFEECKAVKVKEGLKCQGCLPKCKVNQLREMGKRNNFDVYIIPHASDLTLWAPKPGRQRQGVIASACVTTLVEGGWELKRYGVPAQCVLLDYSGCKKHWHRDGFPTQLNVHELKRILNSKSSMNACL